MAQAEPVVDALLEVEQVSVRFGGVLALDAVGFRVPEHSIVGVIGPNGAGKTTLFNVVTRVYRPQQGDVRFAGASILGSAPHSIVGLGIARTFQNLELFPRMSVLDNVLVGGHVRMAAPAFSVSAALALPHVRGAERKARAAAMEILDEVGLAPLAHRYVGGLPYGTLKTVELARALASRPRLLLLDEPAGGLNHDEIGELVATLKRVQRDFRLTMLVVEHHMDMVMPISDRVVCLDFGRKIADGTPKEVQADPRVIEAYLGAPDGG